MSNVNIFRWLFRDSPKENDMTQVLTYFFKSNPVFLNRFIDFIMPGAKLVQPEISTQFSTDNGMPDIRIYDQKSNRLILIEVKVDAKITLDSEGVSQLKRYEKFLMSEVKKNKNLQTSLVLLSKKYFDDIPDDCLEVLWYDVWKLFGEIEPHSELDNQFLEIMKVLGMTKKPLEFEGITEDDMQGIQASMHFLDSLSDLKRSIEKQFAGRLLVESNHPNITRNGSVTFLKIRKPDAKWQAFIEFGFSDGTDSYASSNSITGFYLNIAFGCDKQAELLSILQKRGFVNYGGYVQKPFPFDLKKSKDDQVAYIVKLIEENIGKI